MNDPRGLGLREERRASITKPCGAPGCSGTMHLHDEPMKEPPPPTHLEFPHRPVWVCENNPDHTELL